MSNIEIQRGKDGMHLVVGGQFAMGAVVAGMQIVNGEMTAIVWVPIKDVTFKEVSNVVPLVRAVP